MRDSLSSIQRFNLDFCKSLAKRVSLYSLTMAQKLGGVKAEILGVYGGMNRTLIFPPSSLLKGHFSFEMEPGIISSRFSS